jgi:hypothetical protein
MHIYIGIHTHTHTYTNRHDACMYTHVRDLYVYLPFFDFLGRKSCIDGILSNMSALSVSDVARYVFTSVERQIGRPHN